MVFISGLYSSTNNSYNLHYCNNKFVKIAIKIAFSATKLTHRYEATEFPIFTFWCLCLFENGKAVFSIKCDLKADNFILIIMVYLRNGGDIQPTRGIQFVKRNTTFETR